MRIFILRASNTPDVKILSFCLNFLQRAFLIESGSKLENMSSVTSLVSRASNWSIKSRETNLIVHPLVKYDPCALDYIKVLKAAYFESPGKRSGFEREQTHSYHKSLLLTNSPLKHSRKLKLIGTLPPLPRNQDVPPLAFGKLTGRSILVATSHAWFYQSHPDPHGVKLNLLRNDFLPRLRQKYPYSEILIFDDWNSSPQWPRTKAEDKVFYKCMEHMNSIYCYCDVVIFLEAKLPELDNRIRFQNLVPSDFNFGTFVDVVQFHGPDSELLDIKKNDIIVNPANIEILRSTTKEIKISYLKRSFGRPNRILPTDRGWLFAERITSAIRVASAGKHRFDEIIWSNNEELRNQIYKWTSIFIEAADRGQVEDALNEYVDLNILIRSITLTRTFFLSRYKAELVTKRFTRPDDVHLVNELLESLVQKFSLNWEGECEKQNIMSDRAHEVLMLWGEFSDNYIKQARLLEPDCNLSLAKRVSSVGVR